MEPKAKRIRGWKLEMAKEAGGSEPLLKGQHQAPSALGTLLLTMWSHGHISAKGMQEIAHMAILDGATHPELAQIASAGLWGEIPGNVRRDVMAHYCQDISISPAIHVQVPVLGQSPLRFWWRMPASFCHISCSVIWHTITQINSITYLGPRIFNHFGQELRR